MKSADVLLRYRKGSRDFRGLDLSGISLSGHGLPGCDFSGATLSGADLVTDLRGANFEGADLTGASFAFPELPQELYTTLLPLSPMGGLPVHAFPPLAIGFNRRCTDLRWARADTATRWPDSLAPRRLGILMPGAALRNACLAQLELAGVNLSGADLRAADLHDARLRNAKLAGANLDSADLSGADLRGADLSDATLRHAHLLGTNLRRTRMARTVFEGTVTDRKTIWPVNFDGQQPGLIFAPAPLPKRFIKIYRAIDLRRETLPGAYFRDESLQNAFFQGANLEYANFRGAWLQGAHFSPEFFEDTSLIPTQLTGASFQDARLESANFRRAELCGANFHGAVLEGVHFGGADLRNANFRFATLTQADFLNANLEGADFSFADLSCAEIVKAELRGAIFDHAQLAGALLADVDLTSICSATIDVLEPCNVDWRATVRSLRAPGLLDFLLRCGVPPIFATFIVDCAKTMTRHDDHFLHSTLISYGSPDERFARRLRDALLQAGVNCWFFPEDALLGAKLHREMSLGVAGYDRVILICSRASLSRAGVLNELERVLEREAREGGSDVLLPITLDNFVFGDWSPERPDLADQIRSRVVGDFRGAKSGKRFSTALTHVLRALRR